MASIVRAGARVGHLKGALPARLVEGRSVSREPLPGKHRERVYRACPGYTSTAQLSSGGADTRPMQLRIDAVAVCVTWPALGLALYVGPPGGGVWALRGRPLRAVAASQAS